MNNRTLYLAIILILIGGSIFLIAKNNQTQNPGGTIACTMEAKLCPDGSYVSRTGPNCEFAQCPSDQTYKHVEFNKAIMININDTVVFPDNLFVTLKEINDSRCKTGVVCIWQGELSALLSFNINGFMSEVRLGTVNNKNVASDGYTFSLQSATENSATIVVSKNPVSVSSSGINGYIHIGPTCPVEMYPPNPNCADKPFANAKVNAVIKSSGALAKTVKSDAGGNFYMTLSPGTFIIKVSAESGASLPRCEDTEAVVTANNFTVLNISCDTGIR